MDTTEIQRIIQEYYERLYDIKWDNLEAIDKFLEICDFSRLNHEEIGKHKQTNQQQEIETAMKNLPKKKKDQDQMALLVNSTKHSKTVSQTLQNQQKLARINSFWKAVREMICSKTKSHPRDVGLIVQVSA